MGANDALSIGLLGTGFLGTIYARQVSDHLDADLVAIADVSEENRTAAGEEFGVPPESLYEDHETLLANESLEAVAIATPHALHYEQIVDALDAGLHVLCEKPLVTDLDHAKDLRDRVADDDRVLMVGYQRHIDPAFVRARERWLDDEREPTFVTGEITQNLIDGAGDSWYTDPDLSGGGQIYATGTHLIDAMLWATGLTPTAVTASIAFVDDEQRVDEHATLTLEFDNGAVGSLAISGGTPRVREHLHLWDDDGAVYIDGREWDDRTVYTIDEEGTEHSPHLSAGSQNKVEAFVDAVETGEEPPATVEDALRATAVKEAAYEAARTGERVSIDLD